LEYLFKKETLTSITPHTRSKWEIFIERIKIMIESMVKEMLKTKDRERAKSRKSHK
jgi:hypothetical protein